MADGKDIQVEFGDDKPDDKEKAPAKGKKLKYDENAPNLVETFVGSEAGREWLRKIAKRVMEDFEADFESTEQYRQRMAADFKIFAGELPKKSFPFKNSANAHLPYMLENLSRLQFRAASELFGDWKQPFGVVRIGTTAEEDEIVDVLTVHGNWQIREQMPDFRRQIGDRGLLQYFCGGDVTFHSYWDPVRRRNCHEVLTCEEFVAPFVHVTTHPDYSDLPHYTTIMHRYRHELQAMRGSWYGIDKVLKREPPGWDDDPETFLDKAVAEVHRIEIPTDNAKAPYKLLSYEGWIEMPPSEQETQAKAEPRDRFVQVVMDYATRAILSLAIFEEPSWQEKERFQRQTSELEEYRAQQEMFEQTQQANMAQAQQLQQEMQMGLVDPIAAQQQLQQLEMQAQQMQQPMIPDWLQGDDVATAAPEPMRKEPIYLFTHAVCIEPLVGNLGLSYGRIQADYNRAADTSLSQFVDSATLANVWSLITTNQVQFEKGAEFAPGNINKVTGVTGNLRDHIMELKPAPANPQLFDFVHFMNEVAQSSIQAPAVLSGESGKSGETYRGLSARIEQATKQLTFATQKYADAVKQVMKNNARLNAAFLPEEEMRFLMDYKVGTLRYIKVERKLYERNYDVTFTSDLRYAPQAQRIAEADEVTQMAISTPVLQTNLAFAYESIKKSLEARDRHDMVKELGAKPPVPPVFGFPSMPGMPGAPVPGAPGGEADAGGQQGGEHPGDGGGMQGPSPGVASGPAGVQPLNQPPKPPQEHPPGPGGPVQPMG